MSIHNIHFLDKENVHKLYLNICFLELSEEFPRDSKNEFESATVNEPSVFESLRFYCIKFTKNIQPTVFDTEHCLQIVLHQSKSSNVNNPSRDNIH